MECFSTSNLTAFPDPEQLRRVCKITAALDAVMEPQGWLRYHFFFPSWQDGLQVAKVDNGSGDHLFCLFSSAGTVLKGFDHESALSPYAGDQFQVWPGIYDGLPESLSALLDDPAFEREDVTFCLWRSTNEQAWTIGNVQRSPESDDGSSFLLGTLFFTAEAYAEWAEDYHETKIELELVQIVYEQMSINEETVAVLNPKADFAIVEPEINAILGSIGTATLRT